MVDWADQMADVDASVDEELGDEFLLAIDGAAFVTVKGFVYPPGAEPEISYGALDPMQGKPRLKISKRILAVPTQTNRFKIPQLAPIATTSWRPENWDLIDSGRNWIIDLQKAVIPAPPEDE
jgi:hypothetical protein